MIDGDTFDDDDLMDEDELLYDENQKEDEIVSPRATGTTPRSLEAHTIPTNNLEEEKAEERPIGIGVKTTEPRLPVLCNLRQRRRRDLQTTLQRVCP
ncbi:hypothetical protein DY000_02054335 [Brassica cretica]|uniref:Uncharacterized protein n=1 Tax=Brassica cretica TaxID=69181 RepID=A0ABQ7A5A6_BRACR|nr:hypothetical protein DY000_02054335 [Brassica cretica]